MTHTSEAFEEWLAPRNNSGEDNIEVGFIRDYVKMNMAEFAVLKEHISEIAALADCYNRYHYVDIDESEPLACESKSRKRYHADALGFCSGVWESKRKNPSLYDVGLTL